MTTVDSDLLGEGLSWTHDVQGFSEEHSSALNGCLLFRCRHSGWKSFACAALRV